MKNRLLLAFSIATILSLSAPANAGIFPHFGSKAPSNETAEQKAEREAGNKKAGKKGFLKGCLGGGLAGLLNSRNLAGAVKGCVVGGVVVGGMEWYQENKRQLAEAHALADTAKLSGSTATVEEKTVEVKNKQTGQMEQVQTLDRLTIDFPAKSLAARSEGVQALIKKSAAMADNSKTPVTVSVFGPAKDRAWIVEQLKASLKVDGTTKLVEQDAPKARLELSPVPSL